jgi:branched-chain amino acid transport system ATP-binding protein
VLLLDELSLGLAPVVVARIYGMLPQILASGLTVLLVEQDVSQALRVASHIHCLLEGRTTLEAAPAQVNAGQVEAAYFGLGQAASPPQQSAATAGRAEDAAGRNEMEGER